MVENYLLINSHSGLSSWFKARLYFPAFLKIGVVLWVVVYRLWVWVMFPTATTKSSNVPLHLGAFCTLFPSPQLHEEDSEVIG